MKDFVFVNPNVFKTNYGGLTDLRGIEPPIWCGMRAQHMLNSGYDVAIIDAEALNLTVEATVKAVLNADPKFVDIIAAGPCPSSSSTPKMPTMRELAKELDRVGFNGKVIFSGIHPSALPIQTLREEPIDYVIDGPGFNTLEGLAQGRDIRTIPGLWIDDIPPQKQSSFPVRIPWVAWELLHMDKYRSHNWQRLDNQSKRSPYAALYTSFGCPFSCSYCNVKAMYNNRCGIINRPVADVVDELVHVHQKYKVETFKFADELFLCNNRRVEALSKALKDRVSDLNIWTFAYAHTNMVNREILRSAKSMGIKWLCVGFESGSSEVRNALNKHLDDHIHTAVKMIREENLYLFGNFIYGLPGDTLETMHQTTDLALKILPDFVNMYVAMIYPGCELYRPGPRTNTDWETYSQFGSTTSALVPSEIVKFRDDSFMKFFTNPDYLDMVHRKFGDSGVQHILEMLSYRPR